MGSGVELSALCKEIYTKLTHHRLSSSDFRHRRCLNAYPLLLVLSQLIILSIIDIRAPCAMPSD